MGHMDSYHTHATLQSRLMLLHARCLLPWLIDPPAAAFPHIENWNCFLWHNFLFFLHGLIYSLDFIPNNFLLFLHDLISSLDFIPNNLRYSRVSCSNLNLLVILSEAAKGCEMFFCVKAAMGKRFWRGSRLQFQVACSHPWRYGLCRRVFKMATRVLPCAVSLAFKEKEKVRGPVLPDNFVAFVHLPSSNCDLVIGI